MLARLSPIRLPRLTRSNRIFSTRGENVQGIPAAGSLRVFLQVTTPSDIARSPGGGREPLGPLSQLTLTALPEGEPFGTTLSRTHPQDGAASHYYGSEDEYGRREATVGEPSQSTRKKQQEREAW